jgi:membrane protease YdiL (CAAX protease family)
VPDRPDRELWAEVGVVLMVVLLPMYSAAVELIWPTHGLSSAAESLSLRDSLGNIVNDTSRSGLLLYLIWRSGEPWTRFGFTPFRWTRSDINIILGIVLVNFGIEELVSLLDSDHLEYDGEDVIGSPGTVVVVQYIFLVLHIFVSAFYEELLMRGYLIPRFEHLLRSTWVSLSLTALLFGGFHMDQGMGGVVSATLAGLVYGGAFCWFRRLWPVAAAHAVYNLTVMLLPRLVDALVT